MHTLPCLKSSIHQSTNSLNNHSCNYYRVDSKQASQSQLSGGHDETQQRQKSASGTDLKDLRTPVGQQKKWWLTNIKDPSSRQMGDLL